MCLELVNEIEWVGNGLDKSTLTLTGIAAVRDPRAGNTVYAGQWSQW